jgi:hypothetical protein
MRKLATITVALITLLAAVPALGEYLPEGNTQRDVVSEQDMLTQFLAGEGYVASRLEIRRYSPDPVDDLAEVATTSSNSTLLRSRAVECLALYRTDERVGETLEQMLETVSTRDELFSPVLLSYAQVRAEAAAEVVGEYLDADDSDVRMTAVVALGRFGGYAGFELLQERAEQEEDEQVRERIGRYVQ